MCILTSDRREVVSLPDVACEARDLTTSGCETCRVAAEEEGVQMLWVPVETKQNLLDPGSSLSTIPNSNENSGNMWVSSTTEVERSCSVQVLAARRHNGLLCGSRVEKVILDC